MKGRCQTLYRVWTGFCNEGISENRRIYIGRKILCQPEKDGHILKYKRRGKPQFERNSQLFISDAWGGGLLKRNKQLQSLLTQFGYEHRKLDGQFAKIQKNAEELSKILNEMASSRGKKQEK